MLTCDFNKVALHGCSLVNLLHMFKTPFPKNKNRAAPGNTLFSATSLNFIYSLKHSSTYIYHCFTDTIIL